MEVMNAINCEVNLLGICDFSSVMQTIKEYISDSRELSQTDLLYEIFSTFINDEENAG